MSTTTAEPIAMPAMAPAESLLESFESMDLSAGADVVLEGPDEEVDVVIEGDVVDEDGGAVELVAPDDALLTTTPSGWRSLYGSQSGSAASGQVGS